MGKGSRMEDGLAPAEGNAFNVLDTEAIAPGRLLASPADRRHRFTCHRDNLRSLLIEKRPNGPRGRIPRIAQARCGKSETARSVIQVLASTCK
jgi:hypothetical protein